MPAMQSGTIWALLYLAWHWLWNTLLRPPWLHAPKLPMHVWQMLEFLFVKHGRLQSRFSPLTYKRHSSANIGWPAGIKAVLNHIKPLQIFKNKTMTLVVWKISSSKLFQVCPIVTHWALREGGKKEKEEVSQGFTQNNYHSVRNQVWTWRHCPGSSMYSLPLSQHCECLEV